MLSLVTLSLAGCGGETPAAQVPTGVGTQPTATTAGQPAQNPTPEATVVGDAHITVQHILIGFKDAVGFQGNAPEKAATRTEEQAKTLAYEILDRAKKGENYDDLVKEYTDDSAPGIYSLANRGVAPTVEGEVPRDQFIPAFGDVGFSLKIDEIAMADYDPNTSPYGWHIIKRITPPPPPTKPEGEDDKITLQHILIGFKDAVGFQGNAPEKAATRTEEQAKTLAYEILDRAKKGEDFDTLVTQYTDDSPPGIYTLTNIGVPADQTAQEYNRKGMVPAFGDVGFKLKVGEIGIADYSAETSPYGWHIIKRIK